MLVRRNVYRQDLRAHSMKIDGPIEFDEAIQKERPARMGILAVGDCGIWTDAAFRIR